MIRPILTFALSVLLLAAPVSLTLAHSNGSEGLQSVSAAQPVATPVPTTVGQQCYVAGGATDSDLDGASDATENGISNPCVKDTDRDGYWDGAEIMAGSNPLDGCSTPTQYQCFTVTLPPTQVTAPAPSVNQPVATPVPTTVGQQCYVAGGATDSDLDGASDATEDGVSNPCVKDSDYDNYWDGTEILAGSNPLDGCSVPTGYQCVIVTITPTPVVAPTLTPTKCAGGLFGILVGECLHYNQFVFTWVSEEYVGPPEHEHSDYHYLKFWVDTGEGPTVYHVIASRVPGAVYKGYIYRSDISLTLEYNPRSGRLDVVVPR